MVRVRVGVSTRALDPQRQVDPNQFSEASPSPTPKLNPIPNPNPNLTLTLTLTLIQTLTLILTLALTRTQTLMGASSTHRSHLWSTRATMVAS